MSPEEVKAARLELGLTQAELAERLRLSGANAGDTVRSWESGKRPISGPAQVAIEYMLKDPLRPNILEAIASGDVSKVIAILDPVAKRATRNASEKAGRLGVPVADGREGERRKPARDR